MGDFLGEREEKEEEGKSKKQKVCSGEWKEKLSLVTKKCLKGNLSGSFSPTPTPAK